MSKQDLFLVFGGALVDPRENVLADPGRVDLVGVYNTHQEAMKAWRSRSQSNVDDAYIRYFIAPLHQLMNPEEDD
ncbi:DUF4170 domain-containing protein [Minwuia sp.]|uniref:DUF4170 domain-containing protein n=1 Tax=Minwuia sp. TaxID=2493630 RepID=UPI003A91C385